MSEAKCHSNQFVWVTSKKRQLHFSMHRRGTVCSDHFIIDFMNQKPSFTNSNELFLEVMGREKMIPVQKENKLHCGTGH